MKFIVENWFVIVAIAAVGGSIGYAIYSFVKMPSDKQLSKVREWLLYAVTKAEKELGAGTGKLKLRYVYDMFVARFEWLAKVITFDMFSMMVDEALEQMRTMLDSNEAVQNSLRTRQVRAVSEIEIFMSQHWSTMVTVYIIGAAVTFVLTFVIFWMLERQSEKEEREKELFPEYYEEQETKQDRIMVKLTFFILSVLVAVIWIGVPFILAFIFIMSVIDDSGDKKQKEEKK